MLSVDIELNDRLVDLVDEGFDMAVRVGVLQDSSLIVRKLATVRVVCCTSREYLKKHGMPKTPQDLQEHDGLRYNLILRNTGLALHSA